MTKRALITGAAGGLGISLAQQLDAAGFALVLTDLNLSDLEKASAGLQQEPELIDANLRTEEDLVRLCERLEHPNSPVTLLINNAGIGVPGPVDLVSSDLLGAHIDINLTAPMRLAAAAARSMKRQGEGQIFSVVSLAGLFPLKDSAAYSASKFGLRGFMASLSLELAAHGVKVGGIYPNAIDTPMLQKEMVDPAGSPLNFSGNAKPLTPDKTARAILTAMEKGKLETWLPSTDGRLAGFVMTFPSLLGPIFSYLEKQGNRKKKAYLQSISK
jgi:short-subunit dehydrogenase